jgi:hypothetical protein
MIMAHGRRWTAKWWNGPRFGIGGCRFNGFDQNVLGLVALGKVVVVFSWVACGWCSSCGTWGNGGAGRYSGVGWLWSCDEVQASRLACHARLVSNTLTHGGWQGHANTHPLTPPSPHLQRFFRSDKKHNHISDFQID